MCACTRVQTIRSEQSMESLLSPCSPGWLWASFNDVEHPCQKCGTAVEDGRPFCPQCRAPQIHVQVAISDAEGAASSNPAVGEFSPAVVVETSVALYPTGLVCVWRS